MATGRVPTTANSPLTAKGDLFTYSTAPARLAVGNNGEQIVADSAATTGLRYQGNYAAGKNKIINGDFYINQRAFTSNTGSGTYNFDRWVQVNGGTSGTLTTTPQTFTAGTAPVAGYEGKNYVQCITAAGASTNTYAVLEQKIEDVRTFAGQTVTVSFWAKAATGTPKIGIEFEQDFGTGGSPSATVYTSTSVTISTSWTRYSATVAIPSISGKTIGTTTPGFLGTNLWLSAGSDFAVRAASIGLQNATFQVWGVQVEAGSVATAFQTATGTIQGELAACQRYYLQIATGTSVPISLVWYDSATLIRGLYQMPVIMRTNPTLVQTTGTNYYTTQDGDGFNSLTLYNSSANVAAWYNNTEVSGTNSRPQGINTNNASASLGLSAEL